MVSNCRISLSVLLHTADCFQIKYFFQEPDIHGVSVKNYTQSIIEEINRIKKQNVSNLITVVIGKCRFIMSLNSPFCLFHNKVKLFIAKWCKGKGKLLSLPSRLQHLILNNNKLYDKHVIRAAVYLQCLVGASDRDSFTSAEVDRGRKFDKNMTGSINYSNKIILHVVTCMSDCRSVLDQ
jgi:hypothetical protein